MEELECGLSALDLFLSESNFNAVGLKPFRMCFETQQHA